MPTLLDLHSTNGVYKFKYNGLNCKSEYIGSTQLSLKNTLTAHFYNGSIKQHCQHLYNTKISKETLFVNTKILI